MDRREVAALLAYADRLDPTRAPTDKAAAGERLAQWADLLSDVPPTAPHPGGRPWDASQAVRHHIATSPYPIKPSDVSRPWHTFKADVIGRHHDPVPAVDPDNSTAYVRALAANRTAVATGAVVATSFRELTYGAGAALTPGEQAQAAARRAALGEYMPRTVADALADYRPRRARREQAAAENLPDALDVACPYEHCLAGAGDPCRNARRAPRDKPHPSRIELATTRHYAPENAR
ncbi:zinc finger domain-containing protein [Streptomyces sp. NBC_00343]|uniref:zinc finger domain-containing protein n=1 Tax=Streptomyces sp. NBC_00343 TaxID=2975719 RepID=UPI002E2BA1DF|nr:cell surface glycoprotein [Streptomyces sp. NBC_00343]